MTADRPTILATSGGYRRGLRVDLEFNLLIHHAVELAGVTGRAPRATYVGTAGGDSGPELQPVINGLGFLPYGNGVHYDSEEGRRPLIHRMVADGTLGETHCSDDGVGLVYHGTALVEAVSETPGKNAYIVRAGAGDSVDAVAVEEPLTARLLGRIQ